MVRGFLYAASSVIPTQIRALRIQVVGGALLRAAGIIENAPDLQEKKNHPQKASTLLFGVKSTRVSCALIARGVQTPSVIVDAEQLLRTPSVRPAAQWSALTTLDSRPPASGWDFLGVELASRAFFSGSGAEKPALTVGPENNERIPGNFSFAAFYW